MSDTTTLAAERRDSVGTGAARAVRRSGRVPGIIYGRDQEPLSVSFLERDLIRELKITGFFTKVWDVQIEGGQKETVMARALQRHPVNERPTHIDFLRVSADTEIEVAVPLHFINEDECDALKQGGILSQSYHELPVAARASNIPDVLEFDLANLDESGTVRAGDIKLPKGVTLSGIEDDTTLASVTAPVEEVEEGADEGVSPDEVETTEQGTGEAAESEGGDNEEQA